MTDFENKKIEDAIEENGEVMTSTAGTSMYPMLRNRRDMIVIERVNRPLKRHDVPLYRLEDGKLVLHRILKVTSKGYIIRGDNLYSKEYNVTDKNIIGVLKAFYRDGKFYDCATNRKYKIYVWFWVRLGYPFRFILLHKVRPVLGKFKRYLLKKTGKR